MIRYIVGSIIMLEAALLLFPILTAIVYGEWNTLRVFAGSALFCIVAGALLRGKKPENTTPPSNQSLVYTPPSRCFSAACTPAQAPCPWRSSPPGGTRRW